MNTRERHRALLHMLREEKRVYVSDLAERFNVTTMTARRDLKRLAENHFVTLVHGGAIYNEGGVALASVDTRAKQMQKAKLSLGAYCADLVQEGNAIYLDTGSTVMAIADELAGRENIAVLTHSLPVMNILSDSKGMQLFSMTGIYRDEARGFFGDLTCRELRDFRIDIAFFGMIAISLESGMMAPAVYDQAVKRALIETARKKVAVLDHTKIGKTAFLRVCDIRELDLIVTDKEADADFVAGARKLGVEVVQV